MNAFGKYIVCRQQGGLTAKEIRLFSKGLRCYLMTFLAAGLVDPSDLLN